MHLTVIDLHLHLLPGLDDGARSIDVAGAMIHQAAALGFRELVATPHLPQPLTAARGLKTLRALTDVRQLASPLDVDVRLGYEVPLVPELPERLLAGEAISLDGSRAVLVELPFTSWPNHTDDTLFSLQTAGYRPVLAHPERYRAVQANPELAIELARRGTVLQLTTGSVAGLFGKSVRRTCETLLRAGVVGLVASDAHSAGSRYTAVPEGLERLRELVGEEGVEQLTQAIPHALLHDLPLPELPAAAGAGTGRWFGTFLKRYG